MQPVKANLFKAKQYKIKFSIINLFRLRVNDLPLKDKMNLV